ncbi:MAG TPA: MFS transporter, partial [Dyella sp.]|nr:MFS transporter [Dyella sp.]
ENITPAHPAATSFLQQLSHAGLPATKGLGVVDQLLTREALTLAVNDVFWLCAVLFVLLIPVLWLAKPPFGSAGGAVGH